jgi:hypothetical protein
MLNVVINGPNLPFTITAADYKIVGKTAYLSSIQQ